MTIKLEAGKYYKRRDGEKVYCVGVNPFRPVYSYVVSDQDGECSGYKVNGKFINTHENFDLDITAEWEDEPPRGITVSSGGTAFTQTAATVPAAPQQKLNISEWWVGVDHDGYMSRYHKDASNIVIYPYILQVKDWIAVQQGLKDIEEFKV